MVVKEYGNYGPIEFWGLQQAVDAFANEIKWKKRNKIVLSVCEKGYAELINQTDMNILAYKYIVSKVIDVALVCNIFQEDVEI